MTFHYLEDKKEKAVFLFPVKIILKRALKIANVLTSALYSEMIPHTHLPEHSHWQQHSLLIVVIERNV